MASGNTNFNTNINTAGYMTSTQTETSTNLDKTAPLAHSYGTSEHMTGSTLGHMTGSTLGHMTGSTLGHTTGSTLGHTTGSTLGHMTGSTLGHTTGSTFGTTSGPISGTTAPALSSTSTMGHTTTGTERTSGFKEGEHVSKGTGRKDEFVGGLKETAGKMFGSEKMKAAGYEQKMLGKEEIAAAEAEKGIVGEKGTIGTAAGARAWDETDKDRLKGDKFDKKADKKAAKERAKAEKQAEKEHAKAEKESEKERAKAEKEHGKLEKGHKFDKGHTFDKDKGHTTEKLKEPAHTEPFVGRVDRLGANYGNPHVEPHVAAMMTHGMPIESHTVNTTSYDKPLVSGAYEQKDIHEKNVFDKPLTSTPWTGGSADKPLTGASMDKPFTGASTDKPFVGASMDKPITGMSDKTFTGVSDKTFTGGSFEKPLSGMPVEKTLIGAPIDKPRTRSMDKPGMPMEPETTTSSFGKPQVSGAYELQGVHEKTVLEKPLGGGGLEKETYEKEVILPNTQDATSQKFTQGGNFDNLGSDRLNTKFDRLNVSPRDRPNVSPRNLNVSPRRCDTARLEHSPRHTAQV